MSRRKIHDEDEDPPNIPDVVVFKNALMQFQQLVDRTTAQKREERLGLYVKNAEEIDYDKFFAEVQALFGEEVRPQDVKTFYRKISNNPDGRTEWCEIFGYYIAEDDALAAQLDEENMVFLVSRKQRITKAVKRRDVIKCMVKIPQLDFMVAASQKGTLTVFSSQMRILASTTLPDTSWISGCDYLTQLKRVIAVTERTIVIWDYKSQGSPMDNCFIIKPMEHCLLSVCAIQQPAELLMKDSVLLGDDAGFVNMFTLTSDDFGFQQTKSKKNKQMMVLDSKKFKNIRRKLHDDWVVRVKYIPALYCFGSCSFDSVHSLVLDDLKRLEDTLPVRDFSVPKGVNAFTYCGKANIIVTGGDDKILRMWHPNINTKPVGKLLGHLFSITEIVTNEKDQHIISLSSAKIFRVWDIQTLSMLQVFHDTQGGPKETQIFAMAFDNVHGTLIAGSTVIDIYPLTRMIQDTKQVPLSHERNINVLVYNKIFHQVLTICAESVVKVWELETGQQIYQVEDPHGPNVELTCAAVDKNGFHLATGACDGTMKLWDFGSGQELKMLPLAKENKDNEHWLMQIVYLKASESRHVVLALEYSGIIKIVQCNEGDSYLSVTWELPEAVSLALQGNLLIPLKLSPNAKKSNGFFPDVQLLPDSLPVKTKAENLPPGTEVKCFDVLKTEGYHLLATASVNGAIMMWDFESATTRHIFKSGQTNRTELLGINMILFLHRSAVIDRQLSASSTYSSEIASDISPVQDGGESSVSVKKEGPKSDPSGTATSAGTTVAEGQAELKLLDLPVENKGLSLHLLEATLEHRYIPILASAHEDGCLCLWTITGDLLREIMPYTKHPPIPLTSLCTDSSVKMLFASNKEGHVIRWNIGSFLEDPIDPNKHVKQQVCWRAHSLAIVSIFYENEKNIVVTCSLDSSIRLWHAGNGYYRGYFGQHRPFDFSETTDMILPCDVNEYPMTIKEDNKYLEKKQKFEYPLVFDRERWKTLTKSSLTSKKPGPYEVDQDFKFFKSLASPIILKQPLESFKSGNKDAGIVFGCIPIYRVDSTLPIKEESFNLSQRSITRLSRVVSPMKIKRPPTKFESTIENIRKRSKLISPSRLKVHSSTMGVTKTPPTSFACCPSPTVSSPTMKISKH